MNRTPLTVSVKNRSLERVSDLENGDYPESANTIELNGITREIRLGNTILTILKDITLDIRKGEFVAIMGASGSGKSTLLNILGCLDKPSAGTYKLMGQTIDKLKEDQLASIRNKEIGFVFQSFNLIPYYTALRNVEVPLTYASAPERRQRASYLLERVGLKDRMHQSPSVLSGGEKQRVAIARALSVNPGLILADEPTGALDSHSGDEILRIFEELHAEGKTIVMVTHDPAIARYAERTIVVKDGVVIDERH